MQLPLPLHTSPQRTASALPAPPVIRSTMAPAVALRVGGGDPGRLGHRAGAEAVAAARAGIGDRLAARPEVAEIPDIVHAAAPLDARGAKPTANRAGRKRSCRAENHRRPGDRRGLLQRDHEQRVDLLAVEDDEALDEAVGRSARHRCGRGSGRWRRAGLAVVHDARGRGNWSAPRRSRRRSGRCGSGRRNGGSGAARRCRPRRSAVTRSTSMPREAQ